MHQTTLEKAQPAEKEGSHNEEHRNKLEMEKSLI